MQKSATLLDRAEWEKRPEVWHGEFEGKLFGTNASVMFYTTDEIGRGPPLHRHPYDEVFIVRQGRALFTVGDMQVEATAGQVVFGPANVPHKFVNLGPGRLETTDIHVTGAGDPAGCQVHEFEQSGQAFGTGGVGVDDEDAGFTHGGGL